MAYDFKTQAKDYLTAVAGAVFDGVDPATGDPAASPTGRWLHVPIPAGRSARETMHGLVRDDWRRPSPIEPLRNPCEQSWSLSVVNQTGAVALHGIPGDGWSPLQHVIPEFQETTVLARLVFIARAADQQQSFAGAPAWTADIGQPPPALLAACPSLSVTPGGPARLGFTRLDIAVRDDRSDNGWVYGTLVYDGTVADPNPWKRLRPSGLSWGAGEVEGAQTIHPNDMVGDNSADDTPL